MYARAMQIEVYCNYEYLATDNKSRYVLFNGGLVNTTPPASIMCIWVLIGKVTEFLQLGQK